MCAGKTWMRLAEIYLKRAKKVVFVRVDVDFQYVADVIDLAHHASGSGWD